MPDGRKASGVYADDLIHIANVVSQTTGYHESFHYLAAKFGDNILYNKALEETGKTGGAAEEALAENFAEYMNNKETQKGGIRQFFDKLVKTIKSIFKGQRYADKLFYEMEHNKIKLSKDMISDVRFQELTPEQKKKITNWLTQLNNRNYRACTPLFHEWHNLLKPFNSLLNLLRAFRILFIE